MTRRPQIDKLATQSDLDGLVAALHYVKEADVRRRAAHALGLAPGAARVAEHLVGALDDEAPGVRAEVAHALARIGDLRSVDPLVEALIAKCSGSIRDRPDSPAREVNALRELGATAAAVERLSTSLVSGSSDGRAGAAVALGMMGDARSTEALVAALKDRVDAVRRGAAEALAKIGWKPTSPAEQAWYYVASGDWDGAATQGEAARQPLLAAMDWGPYGDPEEFAAAKAFARVADETVAVARLYEVGNRCYGQAWRATSAESEGAMVQPVADALGDFKSAALKHLMTELATTELNKPFAARLLGKLASVNDARPVRALVDAFAHENRSWLPLRAARALTDMGWQPDTLSERVPYLAALGEWEAVVLACDADVEPLLTVIRRGWGTAEVASALAKVGDAHTIEQLLSTLRVDSPGRTARFAADALGQLPASTIKATVPSVPSALVTAFNTADVPAGAHRWTDTPPEALFKEAVAASILRLPRGTVSSRTRWSARLIIHKRVRRHAYHQKVEEARRSETEHWDGRTEAR